jgi:tetratricopeptide (TPR) repeat protein
VIALIAALTVQAGGSGCPRAAADAVSDSGWAAYRRGAVGEAAGHFAAALSLCPGLHGAEVGRGFVLLRQDSAAAAERRFRAALRSDSTDADAWYGVGLARRRLGRGADAVVAWRRTLALAPGYREAEEQLQAMGSGAAAPSPVIPAPRPAALQLVARTAGERFEVLESSAWRPFYVKGINLGVALPGRFPTEFPPDVATYARWLRLIAEAHANTVRVYTILPPAFYAALRAWNGAHPDQALWLIHGVWAEPPPHDDYDDAAWKTEFRAEMRRVVDVLHGRARLAARPGHASGRYDADVSDHVLAYVIGREWEPHTIRRYNARRGKTPAYAGRFFTLAGGTPADAWMAEQCDYLRIYEDDRYHAQRPIAYTNWPTLDPLHHPTEPTLEEERALRRRMGLSTRTRLHEYDNDGEALDAMLVRSTAADTAGYFASYHAYPYYPDFIGLDSAYGTARSSLGPSHYFGYLQALRRHHAGRPLLIAEYGVPSSRGDAHLQPDGFDHGGHDEGTMAEVDARLTREIREAGLAGGVLFAWIDEWFKHNWAVIDLELPGERTRLWHNVMDAEQHYGLLAEDPGDSARAPAPEPGGDVGPWRALRPLGAVESGRSGPLLRVGSDEAFLYIGIDGASLAGRTRWMIGIDTWRRDRGQFRLPGVPGRLPIGLEFAAFLNDSADAQLRVAPTYNPYIGPRPGMPPTGLDEFYNPAATADARLENGIFDTMFLTTNRFRIARTGRTYPARGVNRGRLRYGRAATSTLADWYEDREAGMIELRIPWGLLNVTDPSSRTVLASVTAAGPFATTTTDGFRLVAFALAPDGRVLADLHPAATFTWPTWEAPASHERAKPAYAAMQRVWGEW